MIVGVRDPHGVRPLVIGQIGKAYVLASETCALDIIGATFVRDVEPGEMVVLNGESIESLKPFQPINRRFCIFEYVYFARRIRSSWAFGLCARKQLAWNWPRSAVEADIVVPVPIAACLRPSAMRSKAACPMRWASPHHYVGRTFIQPTDKIRHIGVKLKQNAPEFIEGKRLVLVDDSSCAANISKIVEMLRSAGAKEVHMRITSPPTKHAAFPHQHARAEKLLAHKHTVEEMAKYINADSLAFISIDGLIGVGRSRP
jgi:amidophosphoribosyltransferase